MFKRKPDPTSVVMAAMKAVKDADPAAVAENRQVIDSMESHKVFKALGQVFTTVGPGLTVAHDDTIRAQLEAVDGPSDVKAATQEIGTALMVSRDPRSAESIWRQHGMKLIPKGDGSWNEAVWKTVEVGGNASRELGMDFN